MATSLLIFLTLYLASVHAEDPIVEISDGKLRGTIRKDFNGNDFYSFRSVPFAKPPLGEYRFKDPKPVDKWEGIRDALEDLPVCFQQILNGSYSGSEDCLYLNVHTPEISPKILKPVMVFIHGGGFIGGTGRQDNFGPEFLMVEDIVLVTINYRLGVLGFLNFENQDVEVPGNAGLKDQLMALKWVKKNIHHFGGDPEKVTIFGGSAGGASVHLLVLSPLSQGYFHRAIAMSGAGLAIWCKGFQNNGPKIAKRLGYEGNDEVEMLKFLQTANFEQLEIAMANSTVAIHVPNVFGPTVEQQSNNAFLPDTPRNLLKKGNFNKVPFMIGYNDQEGMITDVTHFSKFDKYDPLPVSKFIPFIFDLSTTERETLENEIKSFYFPKGQNVQDQINLQSDAFINWAIYDTIFGHLKNQHDVFFYVFFSDTKMNMLKHTHPVTSKYKGACHGDELGYLFTNELSPKVEKNSIEYRSIYTTTKLFANFARYGYPTKNDFDVEWGKTRLNDFKFCNITNDKINIGYEPDRKRAEFWCGIFKRYKPDTMEIFCDWSKVKQKL